MLSLLLETADDYVDPDLDPVLQISAGAGNDAVGGVGVMNLQRAFSPVGTSALSINGVKAPVSQIVGAGGGAFGDWVSNSGAFGDLVFTDPYGRGFRVGEVSAAKAKAAMTDFSARRRSEAGTGGAVSYGDTRFSWHTPQPVYDPAAPYTEEPETAFKAAFNIGGFNLQTGRGTSADSLGPTTSLVFDPAAGNDPIGGEAFWFQLSHSVGALTADIYAEDSQGRDAVGLGLSRNINDWDVRFETGVE